MGSSRQDAKLEGLPVPGYRAQSQSAVDLVGVNKKAEESLLRILDDLKNSLDVDQRWLAIGRTKIEEGFMAINRSIFKPERIQL